MAKRGSQEWKDKIRASCLTGCKNNGGGSLGRDMPNDIPAIRCPTDRELGWAAGFLEGEGNFHKVRTQVGGEMVRASQVNPEPLTLIQEIFGGRLRLVKRNDPSHPKHNDYWHWEVTGKRARGIMMTLYPLLSQKRQEQIEIALRDV